MTTTPTPPITPDDPNYTPISGPPIATQTYTFSGAELSQLIAGIRLAANITTYACPTGCQSPERGASQDCGACRALIALEVAWDLINRKTDTRQRRTNHPPQLDLTNVCVRCWSRPGKRAWFGQLTKDTAWQRLWLCIPCHAGLTRKALSTTPNGARYSSYRRPDLPDR